MGPKYHSASYQNIVQTYNNLQKNISVCILANGHTQQGLYFLLFEKLKTKYEHPIILLCLN